MISLLLCGGLGNQMFQYAFARSLALHNEESLQISCRYLKNDYLGRIYSLDKLNLPDDVKVISGFEEFRVQTKFYWSRKRHNILRKFTGEGEDFYNKSVILLMDFDAYIPELMSIGKNVIILGYFQTQKYFSDCEDTIKRELKVSKTPSSENSDKLNELMNCESVCVHVRRGDYINIDFGKICGYEYYLRSMQYIAEHIRFPVFYFFSNTHEDIEWLKANWKFPGFNLKYIDMQNPDYEELRLMYSCKHFIIANSTFSWWASYLCSNPEKIICAPSIWFNYGHKNIFRPEWVITNCERNEISS